MGEGTRMRMRLELKCVEGMGKELRVTPGLGKEGAGDVSGGEVR